MPDAIASDLLLIVDFQRDRLRTVCTPVATALIKFQMPARERDGPEVGALWDKVGLSYPRRQATVGWAPLYD